MTTWANWQLGIVLWYFCLGLSFICVLERSSFLSSSLCQPLFFVFCLQKHSFTWENLIYHWFGTNWALALDCFPCQKLVHRKSWTTMRKFNCILVLYLALGDTFLGQITKKQPWKFFCPILLSFKCKERLILFLFASSFCCWLLFIGNDFIHYIKVQ